LIFLIIEFWNIKNYSVKFLAIIWGDFNDRGGVNGAMSTIGPAMIANILIRNGIDPVNQILYRCFCQIFSMWARAPNPDFVTPFLPNF